MDTTFRGFHHVKLPLSDMHRSLEWHERVLGLRVQLEFVEEGVTVAGHVGSVIVGLNDPDGIEIRLYQPAEGGP